MSCWVGCAGNCCCCPWPNTPNGSENGSKTRLGVAACLMLTVTTDGLALATTSITTFSWASPSYSCWIPAEPNHRKENKLVLKWPQMANSNVELRPYQLQDYTQVRKILEQVGLYYPMMDSEERLSSKVTQNPGSIIV